MPELADDDLDNIKEGSYVYWMDQDDDIPRGTLGEVIELDGEKRRVRWGGSWPDGHPLVDDVFRILNQSMTRNHQGTTTTGLVDT